MRLDVRLLIAIALLVASACSTRSEPATMTVYVTMMRAGQHVPGTVVISSSSGTSVATTEVPGTGVTQMVTLRSGRTYRFSGNAADGTHCGVQAVDLSEEVNRGGAQAATPPFVVTVQCPPR